MLDIDSMLDMCYSVDMSSTSVRDINPDLWRRLRVAALAEGMPVGQLLNRIIFQWLEDQAMEDALVTSHASRYQEDE